MVARVAILRNPGTAWKSAWALHTPQELEGCPETVQVERVESLRHVSTAFQDAVVLPGVDRKKLVLLVTAWYAGGVTFSEEFDPSSCHGEGKHRDKKLALCFFST